jgi:hypothetical protein
MFMLFIICKDKNIRFTRNAHTFSTFEKYIILSQNSIYLYREFFTTILYLLAKESL